MQDDTLPRAMDPTEPEETHRRQVAPDDDRAPGLLRFGAGATTYFILAAILAVIMLVVIIVLAR
jgi:hypothetical protein